jgi:hypothetical protein
MAYMWNKQVQARALLGRRVEIPVHYDMWMRGARFGIVTQVRSDHVIDYDYLKVIA